MSYIRYYPKKANLKSQTCQYCVNKTWNTSSFHHSYMIITHQFWLCDCCATAKREYIRGDVAVEGFVQFAGVTVVRRVRMFPPSGRISAQDDPLVLRTIQTFLVGLNYRGQTISITTCTQLSIQDLPKKRRGHVSFEVLFATTYLCICDKCCRVSDQNEQVCDRDLAFSFYF
jgi:hypothetical protein